VLHTPQRVVGIGASAGGLEPLRQLVAALPADTGLAIVVLQHLPPSQTGKLAQLLGPISKMPVLDAKDRHLVAPNTIVIVPPRTSATLEKGRLVLRVARGGARPRLPIDRLFESLATALGERAVGVVLSGSANDGTAGLRAIRDVGGLTIAQDPSTAQFNDMPRHAIADGVVDSVLAPEAIGSRIAGVTDEAPRVSRDAAPVVTRILERLREASGIDFTSYKRSTIERRLARQVARHKHASLEEYAAYLAENPQEALPLYEDLLIHVTEFFRDANALEAAVEQVAKLATDRGLTQPIRVWVPGCSSGEEAYSLAMLLIERLGEQQPLQLFGTDLSEQSIERARRGVYPAAAKQVSPARLERFFRREDHGFRIRQDIRERCVFVRHDLVIDPPFSRLDLVSCRNVLIYLGVDLQKRVIPIFHYALQQPGFLALGRSENIAGWDALFAPLDPQLRVFARKQAAGTALTFPHATQLGRLPSAADDANRRTRDLQHDVDQILLARYAPACVVVNSQLDVVQFRGRTGMFLEQPAGLPQLNVVKMTREELAGELRLLLQRAQRSGSPTSTHGIAVRENGRMRRVNIDVLPIGTALNTEPHFAIVFEDGVAGAAPALPPARGRRGKPEGEIARLRHELDAAKEYMRSTTAQHAAASEELGIVNEELQSTNEELQSTNEELQTAKEELQSTNEELETVNEELQRGNRQLRELNDDLLNVLSSVDIPIIIVDTDRRVRRFTPKARTVLRLIPGDIGRPIEDLQPRVPVPGLDGAIASVIDGMALHEQEVVDGDGTFYRMQIRPYRTADHKVAGAVISFVDVTELQHTIDEARAARDFASSIVQTVPTPQVVLDRSLRVFSANHAFLVAFADSGDPRGRELFTLGEWRAPALRAALQRLTVEGTPFGDVEAERMIGSDTHLFLVAGTLIDDERGRMLLIGLADVTDRRRLEQARHSAERDRDAFLAAVSHELRTPLSAILLWIQVLRDLQPGDPQWDDALATIQQSAECEARIVDDLLDLARSQDGELAVARESLDPGPVIRLATDALRAEAATKRITLDLEVAAGSEINADRRRLQHVVMKLVGNAIKFTPADGTVRVRLTRVDHHAELQVIDNGAGIPAAFLPHVFEPFSQKDRTMARAHDGLGIGLTLVRHLVDRQGGTIEVASFEGKGTTFKVRFPETNRG
jgi:two-component system CheB/CheR fusion protein